MKNVLPLLTDAIALSTFLDRFMHVYHIVGNNFNRLQALNEEETRYLQLQLRAFDMTDDWRFVRRSYAAITGIPQVRTPEPDGSLTPGHHKRLTHFKEALDAKLHKAKRTPTTGTGLDGEPVQPCTDFGELAKIADDQNAGLHATLPEVQDLASLYPNQHFLQETLTMWTSLLRDGRVIAYAFRAQGGLVEPVVPQEWLAPENPLRE